VAERVAIAPELLTWARTRAGLSIPDLAKQFPKLSQWESGKLQPTMLQLEKYANTTHAPLGMLFLPTPPKPDPLPIPDFRTIGDDPLKLPSPDLLDAIYICSRRQAWFADHARQAGYQEISFVGSVTTHTDPVEAAGTMREALGFTMAARAAYPTWTDSLRGLIDHAEQIGVLVMISGIVGSNTHRVLDPDEFRGFALVDEFAPLIFINGTDTKAAQIFTLAHELAHLWLGESGVDRPNLETPAVNNTPPPQRTSTVERWCNAVAAELLVPLDVLAEQYRQAADLDEQVGHLARLFKVSTLVILRRLFDLNTLTWENFRDAYGMELERVLHKAAHRPPGGDYYNTAPVRLSKRFARALIADTLSGGTSFYDAFNLIGSKKRKTFDELGEKLGIA